jgi:hypothetical protein
MIINNWRGYNVTIKHRPINIVNWNCLIITINIS